MKTRVRWLRLALASAPLILLAFLIARSTAPREEPAYQGKPLSFWVTKVGQIEEHNGAPEDAVTAIRAIGPRAIPFLLDWMPKRKPPRPAFFEWLTQLFSGWFSKPRSKESPDSSDVEFAWWALGAEGKSAIPTLARILNQPQRTMDDYSVWTVSAKCISYLGPDAIVPMLTVATNMQGRHELWELLHNFENLGTNGAPAIPALIHWSNDPDYWVRDGVVAALGGIGRHPDLAVPVLLKALNDENSMVRRDAAGALGAFADNSDAVLPALIKTLHSSD